MTKIEIQQRNIEITDVLRTHVKDRLGLALGRFADRIGRVIVRFSQADHDQGRADMRCQIEVGLRPWSVDVEDTDADLFAAVNHAADRASRSVARALERERS
jgi:putative sigma-54 modulation protein